MNVGYLTTEYPAVSHTFIRREIHALEALGLTVLPMAVRPSEHPLVEPADFQELKRTRYLLPGGTAELLLNGGLCLAGRLSSVAGAVSVMRRLAARSDRGLLRHVAYLLQAARLTRLSREHGLTHIHVHFGTNAAAVALLARRLGGPAYSFTVHGPDEFDAPIGLSLADKVASARFVACISHYCKAQLRRWIDPADWPKLHIVRCGLDPSWFEPPQPQVSTAGPLRLVTIGRLAPQKSFDVLIDALARRRMSRPLSLKIIGEGPLRPTLERQIAAHNLQSAVALLGAQPSSRIRDELRSADAFVLRAPPKACRSCLWRPWPWVGPSSPPMSPPSPNWSPID